eukprot:s1298_g16.t1
MPARLLEVEQFKQCTRLWREARFEVKNAKKPKSNRHGNRRWQPAPATGNRGPPTTTGNRQPTPATGNRPRQPATGNGHPPTTIGNQQPATGAQQPGPGNWNRQPATGAGDRQLAPTASTNVHLHPVRIYVAYIYASWYGPHVFDDYGNGNGAVCYQRRGHAGSKRCIWPMLGEYAKIRAGHFLVPCCSKMTPFLRAEAVPDWQIGLFFTSAANLSRLGTFALGGFGKGTGNLLANIPDSIVAHRCLESRLLCVISALHVSIAPFGKDALDGDSQEDGNEDFQPGRAVEPLPDVQDLQRRLETLGTCTGKDLPEMKVMVSVQA